MKKIFLVMIIIMFSFNSLNAKNANYEKKWSEEYNSVVPNEQIIDNLYFPWGNIGITSSKSSWTRTPFVFNKQAKGNLYRYLYFWTKNYWEKNHKYLFDAINIKLYNQFNFTFKYPSPDKETVEKRNKLFNELDIEIKVAKFRFQNDLEAKINEQDIRKKLENIYEIMWEAYWKTSAWLQVREDTDKKVCWENISQDFKFNTVYLNNKNIEKYYLFWLPYTNYYSYDNPKNTFFYWDPWGSINKSKSFVISTQNDLKNINKQKFFLKEINPQFEKIEYTGSYSNDNKELYFPKWWTILTQNKVYKRLLFTNKEAIFSLKQKEYLNYFKENFNLYKSWEEYSFWSNLGNKRKYTFYLLWVNKKWDVRVLINRPTSVTLSLSNKLESGFMKKCDKFYLENKYNAPYWKLLVWKKQTIKNIFKKLDKKYKLDEYIRFKNKINEHIIFRYEMLDKEKEIKMFLQNNPWLKKYKKRLYNLSEKVNWFKVKLDMDIYFILQKDKNNILKNKSNLLKKYYIRNIINFLLKELNVRERELSEI